MAKENQRGAVGWVLGLLAVFVALTVFITFSEEQARWVERNAKCPYTNETWNLLPAGVEPVRSPVPDTLPPLESVSARISYE